MDIAGVRQLLKEAAGSNRAAWARDLKISPQYVSDILQGRREPGPAVLEALGLERITTYRAAAQRGDQA